MRPTSLAASLEGVFSGLIGGAGAPSAVTESGGTSESALSQLGAVRKRKTELDPSQANAAAVAAHLAPQPVVAAPAPDATTQAATSQTTALSFAASSATGPNLAIVADPAKFLGGLPSSGAGQAAVEMATPASTPTPGAPASPTAPVTMPARPHASEADQTASAPAATSIAAKLGVVSLLGTSAPVAAADPQTSAQSTQTATPAQPDARAQASQSTAASVAVTQEAAAAVAPATPELKAPTPLKAPAADSHGKGEASPAAAGAAAPATASQAKPVAKPDAAADKPKDASAQTSDEAASASKTVPEAAAQRADAAGSDRAPAPAQQAQTSATSASAPSSPSQPSSALASAAVAQVATEIASHAGSRRTRFEVRLDPGELGRVDVRLDIGHDGRVSTRLIVEKAETLDMLKHDARELTRTLEQAGFQLGQGGLAFQLKDGRQPLWTQEADASAPKRASEDIEEAAPVASAYARPARSGASGVDMTV